MSAKATFWAWDQDVNGYTKLVLLALADNADDFGECYPSVAYIAKKVGISARQVTREISELKTKKLLNVAYNGGRSGANLYQLQVKITHDTQSPPLTHSPATPDTQSSKPNNKPNNKIIKLEKFDIAAIEIPENINREAYLEWCGYRERKKKPVSEDAFEKQIKMLARHPPHVQRKIIDNSISCDYQGLFEPKSHEARKQVSGQKDTFDLSADF